MERATEVYGCGSPQSTDITLNIQTTTGSNFSISLNGKNTIEHLKKLVSKKLRVCKDRICLLHRERQLMDGTLEENGLFDGSRVILLPSVETGLLSSRTENSVMQALESLNDTQVSDFLSGKSPLNLTMRLGDHMMLIQLQLSTLTTTRTIRTSAPTKSSTTSTSIKQDFSNAADPQKVPNNSSNNEKSLETDKPITSDKIVTDDKSKEKQRPILNQQDIKILQNAIDFCHTMVEGKSIEKTNDCDKKQEIVTATTNSHDSNNPLLGLSKIENEQSPIKSLSNLVSSPIDASNSENKDVSLVNSVKSSLLDLLSKNDSTSDLPPIQCGKRDKLLTSASSPTPDSSLSDDSDTFTDQSSFLAENTIDEYPMENLFNSAVDKGLFEDQDESLMDREISNLATTSHGQESTSGTLPSFQSLNDPLKKRFQYLLHKTSKFKHPIGQNKQKAFMQSVVNKHKKRMQNRQDSNLAQPSTSRTEPYITNSRKLILQPSEETETKTEEPQQQAAPSTSKLVPARMIEATMKRASPIPATIDTQALIEASKNLTQKLKKLSKEVLQNKIDAIKAERTKLERPGAVIESMRHHGKGIYSGTFSGTLNPALQDRYGRPKRDISTIIHILNDLLCASPPITLQRDTTHTCASSISSDKKCVGCTQQICPLGQCNGHLASATNCSCKTKECNCNRLEPLLCATCTVKLPDEELCKKCDNAKALALENTKTKCKLEQLRLVMQQKKQRREARKLKTLPYTNAPPKAISSPEQAASIQEEIETVA